MNGIRRAKRAVRLGEVAVHGNRLVAVVDDFATVLLDVSIDDIRIKLAVTGLCELSRCQLVGTNFTSVLQKIAIVRIILHHNKVAAVLAIRVCIDAAFKRDTLASGQSDAVLGLKLFSGILLNGLGGRQDGSSDLDIVLERNVLGIIHGERAAGLYGILDGDILAVALEGYVATSVGSHFAIVEIVAIALDVNVATSNIDGALYDVAVIGKSYFTAFGAKRDFGGFGSDLDNTVRTDYPLRRHRKAVNRRDGAVVGNENAGRIVLLEPKLGMVLAERGAICSLEGHALAGDRSVHRHVLPAGHRDGLGRRNGASEHLRRHLAFHRHVLAGDRSIGIVGAAVEADLHALCRLVGAARRLEDDALCGGHRPAHVDVADRVDRHVAGLGLDRRGRADVDIAAGRHFDVTTSRRDVAVHSNAPRRRRTCGLALQELSRGNRHLLVADDGRRRTLGGKRLEHNVALGLHSAFDRNGALRNNGQVTCMASVAEIDIA